MTVARSRLLPRLIKAVLHQATIRATCLATVFPALLARQVAGMELHCATILATFLAMATAEDLREPIERFNWLMSTNRCETSCTNRFEGCHTGQCSKNRFIIASIDAKSRTRFYFLQRLRLRKNCETSVAGYVYTLGNFHAT